MVNVLLALATLTVAPTMQFTADSVYTNENILTITVQEQRDESDVLVQKDLVFSVNPRLGYDIYDDPETPYLDGLKVDGEWVTGYTYENYDDSVEHTIWVKTVYTDDIAGMFAAAKDGDYSAILKNPITILQILYYAMAALSIIIGSISTLKSKKLKVKSASEIASLVSNQASVASSDLKVLAMGLIKDMITPVCDKLNNQNEAIIKALLLQQDSSKDSKLALIELLRSTASVEDLAKKLEEQVLKDFNTTVERKEKAKEIVKQISENVTVEPVESVTVEDGTSI